MDSGIVFSVVSGSLYKMYTSEKHFYTLIKNKQLRLKQDTQYEDQWS